MASIYETLREDVKSAMKARNTDAVTALRSVDSAIKKIAIDDNREIDDDLVFDDADDNSRNCSSNPSLAFESSS